MHLGADGAPESRRRQEMYSVFGAVVAHVALVAIAWSFAAKIVPAPAEMPSRGLIEFDLREFKPEPVPPPRKAEAEQDRLEKGRDEARGAMGRATLPKLPNMPEPAREPAPEPSASAAPSAPDASNAPVAPKVDEYGETPVVPMPGDGDIRGAPVWPAAGGLPSGPDLPGAAGSAAPTGPLLPKASVAPGRGAQLLREDMAAHDRELGLGNPGGTAVANAAADAVRGSALPSEVSAVLVARVDGSGQVVSVSVQRFSAGDTTKWNAVAQAVGAALGKKKLGLAGLGPKGALVQVDVRANVAYPSGSRDGAELIKPKLLDGPPRDVAPAPSPDGDACAPERWSEVKPLCGVGMKIGVFDVTDQATKKHRNVRATFSVKLLDSASEAPGQVK